jgi:predicted DCC family thiol-disulfide oxidoreductase YuxK
MNEVPTTSVVFPELNEKQKLRALRRNSFNAPPGKHVILFDGHCRFCTRQSRKLVSLARPGLVEAVNFQEAGALDRFPGITHDACMTAIHLVEPDGRVSKGPEAIVRAMATRPVFRWIRVIYYIPGLRQVVNGLYAFVAAHRYQIWGRADSACSEGTCRLHGYPK